MAFQPGLLQMLLQARPTKFIHQVQNYSTTGRIKVTVMGAATPLGKTVSLMLKQCTHIDELSLYDIKPLAPFVQDLNYVDTKCLVSAHQGVINVQEALARSKIVVVLTAAAQTDTTNYKTVFDRNAPLLKEVAVQIATYAPKAFVAVGTEPINSTVPLLSEVMKRKGSYNCRGIFGITTIDAVRANTFVAEILNLEPECVVVPIVGGHTEQTIVPLLSQTTPCADFSNDELEDITKSVKQANNNLQLARSSDGPFLSTAFATTRFVVALVRACQGQPNVVECAYVKSCAHPQLPYMVSPLLLGPGGVMKIHGVPTDISDYEICQLDNAVPLLVEDIKMGKCYGGKAMIPNDSGGMDYKPSCDVCDPNPKAKRCPPDHCELNAAAK